MKYNRFHLKPTNVSFSYLIMVLLYYPSTTKSFVSLYYKVVNQQYLLWVNCTIGHRDASSVDPLDQIFR